MTSSWTSVRPIRFRKQIFDALSFLVQKGQVNISELADQMLDLRRRRDGARLLSTRRRIALGRRTKRGKQPYLTLTEQFIRILRATSLITVNKEIIVATLPARELVKEYLRDELEADRIFLERLLNSRYRTYLLYLKQLFKSKTIFIPSIYSKRDSNLKSYLKTIGFPTTVWSFYILRDFFYEFALLNYAIDEKSEEIFPLYTMDAEGKKEYEVEIRTNEEHVYYWKRVSLDKFKTRLAEAYFRIAGNWDTIIELIKLREMVSKSMVISERQFDHLLSETMRNKDESRIHLSIGTMRRFDKKGYLTKVQSLPISEEGYPFTLIRLSAPGVTND
jgi:hypothetical protein